MKRTILLFLAFALCILLLVGCNDQSVETDSESNNDAESTSELESADKETTTSKHISDLTDETERL